MPLDGLASHVPVEHRSCSLVQSTGMLAHSPSDSDPSGNTPGELVSHRSSVQGFSSSQNTSAPSRSHGVLTCGQSHVSTSGSQSIGSGW